MDIRPAPSLLGPPAATAVPPAGQTPQRQPGAAALPLDEIVHEIVDGILTAADGGRERVSLRLLPAVSAEATVIGLLARVVGSTGGPVRLVTEFGTIAPHRPLAAAPGSVVRFELLSRTAIAVEPLPRAPGGAAAAAPELATMLAAVPDALLPEPDSERLAAVLQLLLAAAPAGPERLRQADDRGPGTVAAAADGQGADPAYWRVIPLAWPYAGITDAYLLRREIAETIPEDAADHPARFLLEFSLPHLGPLQLDGLYRRGRFDLLLRSRLPLPAGLRAEAAQRFRATLSRGALAGGVAFAALAPFPVTAIAAPLPLGIEV